LDVHTHGVLLYSTQEASFLTKKSWVAVFATLLIAALLLGFLTTSLFSGNGSEEKVFVGVDIAYGDESAVYNVTEAVAGYANLIVLGSLQLTTNTTKLTNVCDYLYQKGFYFIVYVGFAKTGYLPPRGPEPSFFQMANHRWGDKFLGAYMFDEAAGKQLDAGTAERPVIFANNFSDAAIRFILGVEPYLNLYKGGVYYDVPDMKLYTSDYALYWYDYLLGYDVVFGEFVGNNSRQITVALTRGAATSQGKQWGAIITFGSSGETGSYLENASQLYSDMTTAWQNGARYIVVFDSPLNATGTPLGILTQEHLDVMKRFWNDIKNHPQAEQPLVDTAYVLPRDYGYGFRGPSDTIWGLWPSDAL
jgi:hypothetical protein